MRLAIAIVIAVMIAVMIGAAHFGADNPQVVHVLAAVGAEYGDYRTWPADRFLRLTSRTGTCAGLRHLRVRTAGGEVDFAQRAADAGGHINRRAGASAK